MNVLDLLKIKKKPNEDRVAIPQISTRYSSYPSNGLTPQKLASIFLEADQGELMRQSELFEEMEEKDPHLFSQLQTRKNAVTGLDFEIIACDSESEVDKRIAEFVKNELADLGNFDEVLLDLLDAIGKGVSFSEIIWKQNKTGTHIDEIRNIHQKLFYWDEFDTLKIRTKNNPMGIELPQNKFIIHKYKARSGHSARAGILRSVAWMYLFKNYDIKDWVSFTEVYGMPLRLGIYSPSASEADKLALMKALISLGSDAAGMMPDTVKVIFQEATKTSSVDLYERLARYCDEQMSKAILGQTLTSDSGGGSYAQSKTHNEVRHDLTAADCKALAATLRRDLITPLVLFNFGDDANVPYIKFDFEEAEDQKETLEIYKVLSQMGLKISSSFLYNKFSIPVPDADEEVVAISLPPFPFKQQLSLKNDEDKYVSYQESIDELADKCIGQVNMFDDLQSELSKIVENCESLEDIEKALKENEKLDKLIGSNSTIFEDILTQALVLADLKGRFLEIEKEIKRNGN